MHSVLGVRSGQGKATLTVYVICFVANILSIIFKPSRNRPLASSEGLGTIFVCENKDDNFGFAVICCLVMVRRVHRLE